MKNIPNVISVIRILLIVPFVVLMLKGESTQAGIVLIISAFTDVLDGSLARGFGWITNVGKVLDPAADKLTQVTVCVVFAWVRPEYIVFFVIMLLKEFLMVACSAWMLKKGESPASAKWFGKAATVVFYCTMILMVLFPNIPSVVEIVLLGITTTLVVFAFVKYMILFVKVTNSKKEQAR